MRVAKDEEAGKGRRAGKQAGHVSTAFADPSAEPRQQGQGCDCRYAILDGEQSADIIACSLVSGTGGIGRAEEVLRDDRRGVDPHDEQSGPAEELD